MGRLRALAAVLAAVVLAACQTGPTGVEPPPASQAPFDHVIVLFLENRSFDHLFGTYPGADGIAAYRGKQTDKDGAPYAVLPAPLGRDAKPDPRFPANLPNAPFAMQRFVGPYDPTNNPIHRFYHMQRQYVAGADGVPMGRWVAEGTSGGTSMGYYERSAIPAQWRLAEEFVLLDRYFQSIHGGSLANHFFLISASVARAPDEPAEHRAQLAPDGRVVKDGDVTPDGYVVNNMDPPYPPQRVRYATGWGGGADAVRQGLMPHHNPFQYVKRIMETPEGRSHIRDASEFTTALRDGSLPSVAFVKPHAKDNAHPATSTVGGGDRWVGDMVREIMASRYWPRVVVVITYDEGGGWFDHVKPPAVDRFGLGSRVPTLIVSPYARRRVVGHGQYDHASILKLIEWRFALEPLTERDRGAATFLEALDFSQSPRPPVSLPP